MVLQWKYAGGVKLSEEVIKTLKQNDDTKDRLGLTEEQVIQKVLYNNSVTLKSETLQLLAQPSTNKLTYHRTDPDIAKVLSGIEYAVKQHQVELIDLTRVDNGPKFNIVRLASATPVLQVPIINKMLALKHALPLLEVVRLASGLTSRKGHSPKWQHILSSLADIESLFNLRLLTLDPLYMTVSLSKTVLDLEKTQATNTFSLAMWFKQEPNPTEEVECYVMSQLQAAIRNIGEDYSLGDTVRLIEEGLLTARGWDQKCNVTTTLIKLVTTEAVAGRLIVSGGKATPIAATIITDGIMSRNTSIRHSVDLMSKVRLNVSLRLDSYDLELLLLLEAVCAWRGRALYGTTQMLSEGSDLVCSWSNIERIINTFKHLYQLKMVSETDGIFTVTPLGHEVVTRKRLGATQLEVMLMPRGDVVIDNSPGCRSDW